MKPHRRTSRADSLTSRFGLACCYEHASSEPSLQPQLRLTETGGNDHRRGVPSAPLKTLFMAAFLGENYTS